MRALRPWTHRRLLRRREAAVWLATLAGCGGSGGSTNPPISIGDPVDIAGLPLTKQLDLYLASAPADQPGISVLVMQDGVETYSSQRGMANSLTRTAITRHTGFRLASVSKPFTAVAVMQLVEQGQLKLSDALLDYLPELPEHWRPITLEHLLTHTSGIVDIFNDFWTPAVFYNMTLDGLLTYLASSQRTLEFPPGSRGDYSNTGFMLLAKVIERRTGRRFGEHMAEALFKPAGMLDSYINDEYTPLKAGDALNRGTLSTYYGFTTYFKGSMAQVSSADDFLHFYQALLGGRLVKPETLAEMARPHSTVTGGGRYGLGFGLASYGLVHYGEWDGFWTLMAIDTHRKRAWTALTNSGTPGRTQVFDIERLVSGAL
ncbi:serine hydrolase domain-containing protein [Roseateles sp.]|uniref:serine hydrolase domain-containing protein n=1 Tax=Roseateles sp. TaxID=1971397 RepID=UPI0039593B79